MDWTDVEMELSAAGREDLAEFVHDAVIGIMALNDAREKTAEVIRTEEREYCVEEFARLKELERRVAKRCAEAVPQWAPELRELLRPSAESDRRDELI